MLTYLPIVRLSGARALFLVTAVLTGAIVWWSRDFGSTHMATLLAPIFAYLFATFDYPASVLALAMLVVAAFAPQKYSFRPLLSWITDHVWLIAGLVCVALCIGTRVFYLSHPLAQDECAPYFQSKIFAAGHLTGQIPPGLLERLIPPTYENNFYFVSHATGRIASTYWPSFALLLTPFTYLGIPWACNPVISALTLPVIRSLALRIFADRETAGLAVLLTLASPVFFADGISYYSMSAHLLANSLYALLLLDPTPRRVFTAGVVGSVALTLHNPVPHMLFAVPWLLFIARRSDAAKLMGCLLLGYLPLCLLLGLGWTFFAGAIAHDGLVAAGPASQSPGGLERFTAAFAFPDQSIWIARFVGILKIWIWAVPGMALLAVLGAWKWRRDPLCRVFASAALATLLGYMIVPLDQGHGWGYRYFHSAWMVVPLLAAAALARVPIAMQSNSTSVVSRLTEDTSMRDYLVTCALLSLTLGGGLRAFQIREFLVRETKSPFPDYTGIERRVMLANGGADLVYLDPWLKGNVVYLKSLGPEADAAMMHAYFPDMHQVFADSAGTVWSARIDK